MHGHTPMSRELIENQWDQLHYLPVLDIDAGCAFEYTGLGHLCAVDLDNREFYFQARIDPLE